MITWISANLVNIVVLIILIAIVTAAVFKLIKDKRNGNCSCGAGCKSCGMCPAVTDPAESRKRCDK